MVANLVESMGGNIEEMLKNNANAMEGLKVGGKRRKRSTKRKSTKRKSTKRKSTKRKGRK